jgi:small-conductance mechanosensitive channel
MGARSLGLTLVLLGAAPVLTVPDWLVAPLSAETLRAWLVAAAVAFLLLVVVALAKRLLVIRGARTAAETANEIDDFLVDAARRTRWVLLLFPALYLGALVPELSAKTLATLRTLAVLGLLVQAALWGLGAIDFWISRTRRRRLAVDAATATAIGAFGFIGKLFLFALLLLLALDNLGVDVTALVAGLGVGGIAIALAVQNILGDLLASLSIVMDKPFVIGDTIHVGEHVGTVESIGLKTTRLRSIAGEQLIFANGDLLQSRIRNYKRMSDRRGVLVFGVTYQTPAATLREIPGIVRRAVEAEDLTRFDRCHLRGFADSALEFEAIYFVLSPDMGTFMDRQQAILLAVFEEFERRGIDLAYPTRTVWLEGSAAAPPAERRPAVDGEPEAETRS